MKKTELKKRFERIEKKIREERVIENAIGLTKKLGRYNSQVHSYHTSAQGSFNGVDSLGNHLVIEYESGYSMFGGGKLNISYSGKRVFEADESDKNPEEIKKEGLSIKVDPYYITLFKPGEWQKEIKFILSSRYKNKQKNQKHNPEVNKGLVSFLSSKFPLGDI